MSTPSGLRAPLVASLLMSVLAIFDLRWWWRVGRGDNARSHLTFLASDDCVNVHGITCHQMARSPRDAVLYAREQVSQTRRASAGIAYDHQMAMLHHRVEGSGPVVVLLHAGVADLRMWDAQVDALPGRKVVRCDLPGYGGTPVGPDTDGCDAEDVLDLLDRLGVAGFALVGASYGGYVALQVASAVPHRVERLVLLDTAADVVEPDDSLRDVWRREQSLIQT